jgi:hypothetical protein
VAPADPWLPLAKCADLLAQIAGAASWAYPQATLATYGFKVAALMLRHPAFLPVAMAQTAHHFPYWR